MSILDSVKQAGTSVVDALAGAAGVAGGYGIFSVLLDQVAGAAGNGKGGVTATGGVGGDGTSDAVRSVLIGQQAVVPMGMEDKGHMTQTEKDAMEMLSDMTENGLNGYWKWVMKQLREKVMDDMGISEQELAAMDPDARAAVEKAIEEEVKKRLAEMMGSSGKKTADGTPGGKDEEKDGAAPVAGLTA